MTTLHKPPLMAALALIVALIGAGNALAQVETAHLRVDGMT